MGILLGVLGGGALAASVSGVLHTPNEPASTAAFVSEPSTCSDAPDAPVSVTESAPRETVASTIADADDDGLLDILFTNQLDESVTVWWGREGGLPRESVTLSAGRSGFPVRVGDLDGDSRADLLVSLQDDAAFTVLSGKGGRAFGEASRIVQGPGPRNVRLVTMSGALAALFDTSTHVNVRAVQGGRPWPRHRSPLYLGAEPFRAFIQRSGAWWVAQGRDPAVAVRLDDAGSPDARVQLSGVPQEADLFTADLVAPYGDEEIYTARGDGSVWRLPWDEGGVPCVYMRGLASAPALVRDGQRVWFASSKTCSGCTSNFLFGYANLPQ